MKRADIDRWTSKRFRDVPGLKGFIVRREQSDVEAFKPTEHAEVSKFCKPGDSILSIMPDDSVGITYNIEEVSPPDPAAAAAGAALTGAVIKGIGEQISKAYEGIMDGYERVITSLSHELSRKTEEIDRLSERLAKSEGKSLEMFRAEQEQRLEESKMRHSQVMTEEYLGRTFTMLDQVVDGFLTHHSRKDKLKGIFHRLKPETLQAIMGDLSENDVNDLLALAEDLDKDEQFSSTKKKLPT